MAEGLRLDKVLDALARATATDRGATLAAQLRPAATQHEAEIRLAEVAEAETLLQARAAPGLPARLDLGAWMQQAERGIALEPMDLAIIGRLARATRTIRRGAQQWPSEVRLLRDVALQLPDLELLGAMLADAIDDDGRILDTASPELARLRQEVLALATRLRRRIEALVKESDAAGLLQDEYYTLRDDRYVLPMRASEKRTLPGIIHGTSQTGHTVYVEPQELVEGNNQLALAYEAVRREERRIIAELTSLCAEHADDLHDTSDRLVHLDLRMAAATLAGQLHAHKPVFTAAGVLDAPKLRHPVLVLDGVAVVPADVRLRSPQRWLVISGPNGGGKTVVLTALGLLVEMARLGLFVCASADVQVPWFDHVALILGDAQDLERGLSTFEGHLRWVARALDDARREPKTLLLFDELASGTEPAAGSALATAMLEQAAATLPQAWGAVTTHFEACKLLGLREPAFVNAALELDSATLTPTYRLTLGQVGASNPLALATRIGLPAAIVDRAQQLLGTGGSEVADLLARLGQERTALQVRIEAVEQERRQLAHSRTLLEDQRRNEQRSADRRIDQATREVMEQLQQVARDIDQARQAIQSADRKRMEEAARTMSQRQVQVEAAQRAAQDRLTGKPQRLAADVQTLQPGATAWHAGLDRAVEITEVSPKRDRYKVKAGGLEMWCLSGDLRMANAEERKQAQHQQHDRKADRRGQVQVRGPVDATALPQSLDESAAILRSSDATVDVRGMRAEEAVDAVDRHLDRAVLSGKVGICVVHGMGTGALRDAVRSHLRRHPSVGHFRAGQHGEGGDGATLVWLQA